MAANDREEVALSSSELDDVLQSADLVEGEPAVPADDLELYGVWVKVKPQPVAAPRKAAAPPELADLETAESAELTEDEQSLLSELESGVAEEPLDVGLPSFEPEMEADAAVPALLPEESLSVGEESLEFPEPTLESFPPVDAAGDSLDEEIASLDEELLGSTEPEAADADAFPVLEEEEISLEPLSVPESEPGLEPVDLADAASEDSLPSLGTEMSLEIPEESDLALDDAALPPLDEELILEEVPSLEDVPSIEGPLPSLEEDLALEEPLPAMDELVLEEPSAEAFPERSAEAAVGQQADEELSLEEATTSVPHGVPGLEELEAAGAQEPETPLFDDGATGIDLEAVAAGSAPPSGASRAPADVQADPAALILAKIEQELHAIRREISDLKGELVVLRAEREDLVDEQEQPEAGEARSGFFGGDDDETIALTGDELDNILSTADITETREREPSAMEAGEPLYMPGMPDLELGDEIEPAPEALSGLGEIPDVIDMDVLEHDAEEPGVEPELAEETAPAEEELRIPEEELIDASGEEISDESSLLPSEPLDDVDIALDVSFDEVSTEEAMVETEVPDGGGLPELDLLDDGLSAEAPVPEEIVADLAAEAEAAIAEPRTEPEDEAFPSGDDLVLETEPSTEGAFGLDLDLEAELAEPGRPDAAMEGEIELDIGISEEPALGEAETLSVGAPEEELSTDSLDTSVEVTGIHEAEEESELVEEAEAAGPTGKAVPEDLRDEIKSVLAYLDQLLEALPDEKIEEFAKSEYFGVYKKLFVELGLEE